MEKVLDDCLVYEYIIFIKKKRKNKMKKSQKIIKQYLQDSNDYNEFLLNHNLSQKDYTFKNYCEDVK